MLLFALLLAASPCQAPVQVTGHGVPAEVVDDLRVVAPQFQAQVSARLGATSCAPIEVALLPAVEGASQLDPPWHLPTWAAGAAVPSERRVVLGITADGRRQDRERVLLHELAHVAVRDAAGDAAVPRWLDEGIARVLAGEHSTSDLEVLARATLAEKLLPLSALEESFPARPDLAAIAYAEAGRAVSLLEGQRPGAAAAILARLKAGDDVDDALEHVTGRRAWQLEVDVARSIPKWRAWAIVGREVDLILAAGAMILVWAGWRARRRVRDAIAAMPMEGLVPDVAIARWTVRPSS